MLNCQSELALSLQPDSNYTSHTTRQEELVSGGKLLIEAKWSIIGISSDQFTDLTKVFFSLPHGMWHHCPNGHIF